VAAPFSGVVTNVAAEQGKAANGALLAVGDDSKLLVRADVKEVDVSKITPGLPVTFTTVGTGAKEFHGRVTSVSSVSGSPQQPRGGAHRLLRNPRSDLRAECCDPGLALARGNRVGACGN